MTTLEAVNLYVALDKILTDYSFNARVCFSIVKNKNKLKTVYEDYLEAKRIVLENLAEKDSDGKAIINNEVYQIANEEEFKKQNMEILKQPVELDFEKICIDDLGDKEINGKYLEALSIFF